MVAVKAGCLKQLKYMQTIDEKITSIYYSEFHWSVYFDLLYLRFCFIDAVSLEVY